MFYKKHFLIICALLGASFATTGSASVVECNWCNSQTLFSSYATTYLGTGTHTIYNLRTGAYQTYHVQPKPGVAAGLDLPPELLVAIEVATPSDLAGGISAAAWFFGATGGTMRAFASVDYTSINIPGVDNEATAYDVVVDANLRARLGDAIAQNMGAWDATKVIANNGLQIFKSMLGLKSQPTLEVSIVFADGSSVVYEFNFMKGSDTAVYMRERSRTPKQQLVPEPGSTGGTWYGLPRGGDDMGPFGSFIQKTGGSIDWEAIGSSPIEAVTCVQKAGEAGLICTQQIVYP